MNLHTLGPWEIELIVGLPRVISDSRRSTCRVVADIHIDEGFGALMGKDKIGNFKNPALRAEIAANARLIAAAPELLEACEYMHQLLTDMGHGGLAGAILGENAIRKAIGQREGSENCASETGAIQAKNGR